MSKFFTRRWPTAPSLVLAPTTATASGFVRSADIEICAGATPEIQAKIKELKDDLLSNKIKVKVG